MAATIKLKRGPEEDRLNFIPLEGELILDTTHNLLYVGDGITPGGLLITNSSTDVASKIMDGDLKLIQDEAKNYRFILNGWVSVVDEVDLENL